MELTLCEMTKKVLGPLCRRPFRDALSYEKDMSQNAEVQLSASSKHATRTPYANVPDFEYLRTWKGKIADN